MIKLKDILAGLLTENMALDKTQVKSKPLIVYHGTGAKFKKFDTKKSTQGIIWFTSDKNKILKREAGAQGSGYIIKAEVTIDNPAGWDEYEKLSLWELKRNGFDGAILADGNGQFDCFVFSADQIKILETNKIGDKLDEGSESLELSLKPDSRITSNFRDVRDGDEAIVIQNNYEKYASRAGINPTDLISHLMNGHGTVYNPYNSNDYLVGQFIGDVFAVSHFAPETSKSGIDMLLDLLHSSTPAVFAVPDKISTQLEKIGYSKIASGVPMRFKGDVVDKNILINNSINKKDLLSLLRKWMEEASSDHLLSNDPKVQLFFKKLKDRDPSLVSTNLPLKEEDYRGTHKAPDKENGAPLYKLNQTYPDDIYSINAARYYGDQSSEYSDNETISIMQSVRDKPNAKVKIYRTVPKAITNQEKIDDLEKQKAYILKRGKVPPNANTSLNSSQYYELISKDIERLKALPEEPETKIEINPGDWVTINKKYAIVHGKSALRGNYRILSKIVPAKHLYTDANSIHEFGYDPN